MIIQQIRNREHRKLNLPSSTETALSPIRQPYSLCSVLSQELLFPLKMQLIRIGRNVVGDFSTSISALKKYATLHKQFLEYQRALDRLYLCSWYLATLNCLSFAVCGFFWGTSLKAVYSPRCHLDLAVFFHLSH